MKLYTMVLAAFLVMTPLLLSQEIKATTEDGKSVILYPDGTWKYEHSVASGIKMGSAAPSIKRYRKPANARKLVKGKRVKYGIWYDENKWFLSNQKNSPSAEYEFANKEGDMYALVIPERLEIPLETLKNIALQNAQNADPNAKIVFEEKRVVNDTEVLCVQIEATIQGIPFKYFNYYYTGKEGTIQVMTYTGQSLFEEYRQDMENFLNGFVVFHH